MAGARATARVALAAAAAALLSACVVEVDGARCGSPGTLGSCPAGQACGNDGRCSARARACVDSGAWCTPFACQDPALVPSTAQRHCTGDDPVCGAWVDGPCTGGLQCALRTPAGGTVGLWCACPDLPTGSRELFVSPGGSRTGAVPFPTGAATPAGCAFRRLGDALSQADPAAVATVTAVGAGTDPATATTIVFSSGRGETFPLVVNGGITLRSDAQAGGGTYDILFDGEGLPSAPVVLHSGGALAGFKIQNGTGGSSTDAIRLSCGAPDPVLLTSIVLDGAGANGARMGRGFAAGRGCTVFARDLTVQNMSTAGLVLDPARLVLDPAPVVSIAGGSIRSCGDGVAMTFGRLTLRSMRIEGNAGKGVRANDPVDLDGSPSVEIRNSKVVGNGDTGIVVRNPDEVRITGTTSSANGAMTVWGYGYSTTRNAGGIVLIGNPPPGAVEFARNRIYKNDGDQLLVMGANAANPWNLDGPSSCAADSSGPPFSMIGSPATCDPQSPAGAYGIVAVDASVSAQYFGWASVSPQPSDVGAFGVASVTVTQFCGSDLTTPSDNLPGGLCSLPP